MIDQLLREIFDLTEDFITATGLEDPELYEDFKTPKMPEVVDKVGFDILSDILTMNADLSYYFSRKE